MRRQIIKSDWLVFVAYIKVFRLARTWNSRLELLKLFHFTLFKRLAQREGFRKSFHLSLRTRYGNTSVMVRDMADITTVSAIFYEGEYELDIKSNEVDSIVDLGANIGVSVAYFHLVYPRARIIAVEADPDTFTRLTENCRDMNRVEFVNVAIARKTGPLIFHSNESSVSGSIYSRAHGVSEIEVRGITIDDLVRERCLDKVSILKFDIEGAEFDAFPASPYVLSSAKAITGEVHPDIGNKSGEQFLNLFIDMKTKVVPREKNRFILKAVR
jgi:FkbM family methyltransferase